MEEEEEDLGLEEEAALEGLLLLLLLAEALEDRGPLAMAGEKKERETGEGGGGRGRGSKFEESSRNFRKGRRREGRELSLVRRQFSRSEDFWELVLSVSSWKIYLENGRADFRSWISCAAAKQGRARLLSFAPLSSIPSHPSPSSPSPSFLSNVG